MSIVGDDDWDERYSVIEDKGDAGFLDYEKDKSLYSFDPLEDGPVVISVPFPFVDGKPQSALIGETSADSISIKNTTSDPIELWSVRIFSSNPENTYLLSLMKPPLPGASEKLICAFVGLTALDDRVLQPGQTLNIWLSCKPKEMGLHTAVVHFDVGDEKIERVAFLLAEDKVSLALFSTKPYLRAPSRGKKHNYDRYVAGPCPPRSNTQVFRYKLPQYPIPPDVREMVGNKQVPDVVIKGLSASSYGRYFSTLIAMDEIHLKEEMRMHDMEHVIMKRRGYNFLSLEVPGLAERRPSLVYGDYIFANLASKEPNNGSRPYQGYIHKVEADEIFLKFDRNFHQNHRDDFLYNVSFTYNRVNMRRLYQAVYAAENLGPELLFPSDSSQSRIIKACPFQPLNPLINREQGRSVEMILGCRGAPPYVIHGPPGTGKTMTLMEAILQVFTTRKTARILVCASSNSAADHILERLLGELGVDIRDNEIFRLNAITRPFEDINADYIRFCFFDDVVFRCPPLKALLRYKIIISTYMSASYLYAEGIRKGHFSHIFLDEAGQASEPETMVPISNLCTKQTVIVLAGDPMQLGPVIHSRSAETYGLGKSYLERLFESHHYQNNNENYVTKLVRNYRCHPAILELPSKLFYKSELIACKQEDESSLYEWEDLPNKSFPVLFVGIQGCDEREGSDPSWFNRIEASKVVEIIRKLMRNTGLSDSDIGVITPYRQQVLKLKKALESLEISDLKVGSVEQFQGQERQVIIISTVRSTVKYNEFDRIHNLGFLSNPRRFNVSTTRAKSLLIIVGNPHIITKDPYWDKLLRYCADHGSYQGCPLPPPEDHDYSDGAAPYGGGQEFRTSDSNAVRWGRQMPNNYTNDVECDEDTPNQYSNEVERDDGTSGAEWSDQVLRSYSNDAGWHDPTSKEYSNETDWGHHTLKPYNNGAKGGNEEEWYDDSRTHNSGSAEWNNDSMKSSSYKVDWVDDASEAERADDNYVPHSSGAEQRNEDPNHYCYGRRIRVNLPKAVNFGWND